MKALPVYVMVATSPVQKTVFEILNDDDGTFVTLTNEVAMPGHPLASVAMKL